MIKAAYSDKPLELNRYFDYAALQSVVAEEGVRTLCAEAVEFQLFAVCLNPIWISLAAEAVAGSDVRVVSVAGFPLGASRTEVKVLEAVEAAQDGAHEIDVVANIGWLCSNRFVEAEAEIRKVRRNLPESVLLKVIIEASKLSPMQQIESAKLVANAGAQFVKTGTGFFETATIEQVRTLYSATGGQIQVKAAGGIRTWAQCRDLIDAGASRLGSSCCPEIIRSWKSSAL